MTLGDIFNLGRIDGQHTNMDKVPLCPFTHTQTITNFMMRVERQTLQPSKRNDCAGKIEDVWQPKV